MKLAEALMERAELSRKLHELTERLLRNAQYQEGEEPAEDPQELLRSHDEASERLEQLILRINLTNNQITLADGSAMVAALARRDVLKLRHATYKKLAAQATPLQGRYSRSEIRYLSAVNVKMVQTQADEIAKAYRELDGLIQQANWLNEVV